MALLALALPRPALPGSAASGGSRQLRCWVLPCCTATGSSRRHLRTLGGGGVQVATGAFRPYIVPLTVAILVALFFFQRRGTGRIGKLFWSGHGHVVRDHRAQDRGLPGDVIEARRRWSRTTRDHDRTKELAILPVRVAERRRARPDGDGQGNDIGPKRAGRDLQPLHRREYGDGRRDDPVAVQQGSTQHRNCRDPPDAATRAGLALGSARAKSAMCHPLLVISAHHDGPSRRVGLIEPAMSQPKNAPRRTGTVTSRAWAGRKQDAANQQNDAGSPHERSRPSPCRPPPTSN